MRLTICLLLEGFPCSSVGKESTCNAGDQSSIPLLGRYPGEGNGNPLQYSWLKNPIDRVAWWAIVRRVCRDMTERLSTHTQNMTSGLWSSWAALTVEPCLLCFYFCLVACGILVLQPGIEPGPLALEAQNFNHWTAGEVPLLSWLRAKCQNSDHWLDVITLSGPTRPPSLSLGSWLKCPLRPPLTVLSAAGEVAPGLCKVWAAPTGCWVEVQAQKNLRFVEMMAQLLPWLSTPADTLSRPASHRGCRGLYFFPAMN